MSEPTYAGDPYEGDADAARPSTRARVGFPGSDVKARVLEGFGGLVDKLEANIHRAPADMQPAARKAVDVARARPLLTMAGLVVGALVLARGGRRRR